MQPLGSHLRQVHSVTERFMEQACKGRGLVGALTTW